MVIPEIVYNYYDPENTEISIEVNPTLEGYKLKAVLHRASNAQNIVYMGWSGGKVFLKNIGTTNTSTSKPPVWNGFAIFKKN